MKTQFNEVHVAVKQEDQEIINSLKTNPQDYQLLVERYKDQVFSLIMRVCGNKTLAEDLTQETFVKAYFSISGFKGNCQFAFWLKRIAINNCHNYFNSKHHRKSLLNDAIPDKDLSLHSEADYILKDKVKKLHECLAKLKSSFQEAIILTALDGKNYQEVAAEMNVPVGTVKSRLNTARLLLVACMNKDF